MGSNQREFKQLRGVHGWCTCKYNFTIYENRGPRCKQGDYYNCTLITPSLEFKLSLAIYDNLLKFSEIWMVETIMLKRFKVVSFLLTFSIKGYSTYPPARPIWEILQTQYLAEEKFPVEEIVFQLYCPWSDITVATCIVPTCNDI